MNNLKPRFSELSGKTSEHQAFNSEKTWIKLFVALSHAILHLGR